MKGFVDGVERSQGTLFPERLEDWIGADNPVRVIDVFVDELDLGELGFERIAPLATGRPGYHPSVPLKLYIYGYLDRVQSSRRHGAGGRSQRGGDVADRPLGAGSQDDCELSQGQWRKDNGGATRNVLRSLRHPMPPA